MVKNFDGLNFSNKFHSVFTPNQNIFICTNLKGKSKNLANRLKKFSSNNPETRVELNYLSDH